MSQQPTLGLTSCYSNQESSWWGVYRFCVCQAASSTLLLNYTIILLEPLSLLFLVFNVSISKQERDQLLRIVGSACFWALEFCAMWCGVECECLHLCLIFKERTDCNRHEMSWVQLYLHLSHLTSYIRARGLSFFSSKEEVDSFFKERKKEMNLKAERIYFGLQLLALLRAHRTWLMLTRWRSQRRIITTSTVIAPV